MFVFVEGGGGVEDGCSDYFFVAEVVGGERDAVTVEVGTEVGVDDVEDIVTVFVGEFEERCDAAFNFEEVEVGVVFVGVFDFNVVSIKFFDGVGGLCLEEGFNVGEERGA